MKLSLPCIIKKIELDATSFIDKLKVIVFVLSITVAIDKLNILPNISFELIKMFKVQLNNLCLETK